MQINENLEQAQKVKRIPVVDEAPIDKRAMLNTLDDGPRPGATRKPEVADEPTRKRRFGAGF